MANPIELTLPPRVEEQMRRLVAEGWFYNEADLLTEALRRFLESHQAELMERFIREDVRWGLDGVQ